jgi:hypothetical protein
MPPLSLFDNSHRPKGLEMPACSECNRATSIADLTVAIISRWGYDAAQRDLADHERLVQQLVRQAPELRDEWVVWPEDQIKVKQHLLNHGVPTPLRAGVAKIGPLTMRQLNLFAHKAVLALYFEHFKQPLGVKGGVCAYWKSKEDFARNGIPEPLLKILPRYGTLVQGKWNESKTFEYRHDINPDQGLFGCFVRLRGRFFIGGFAVADLHTIPDPDDDWVAPADPDVLLDSPRFKRKL